MVRLPDAETADPKARRSDLQDCSPDYFRGSGSEIVPGAVIAAPGA